LHWPQWDSDTSYGSSAPSSSSRFGSSSQRRRIGLGPSSSSRRFGLGAGLIAEAGAAAVGERGSLGASSGAVSGDTGGTSSRDDTRAVIISGGQALADAFPLEAVPFLAAVESIISAVDEVVKFAAFMVILLLLSADEGSGRRPGSGGAAGHYGKVGCPALGGGGLLARVFVSSYFLLAIFTSLHRS